MKFSIIIPVYNAANYITKAVESSLMQPETGEVVLVEDGSTDVSSEICGAIAKKYDNVFLYSHDNGGNKGPGASRNLGIKESNFDYIAFLDADDYFLPSRFAKTKKVFASDPYCDGVYEAAGIFFENKQAKIRWGKSDMAGLNVTTVSEYIPPEELFETLLKGELGYFSIIGLTIKKSVIEKTGYMNEKLRLHQDTEFILRLAAMTKLLPGSIDNPVVIRRVHDNNRIAEPRSQITKFKRELSMWLSLYKWLKMNGFKEQRKSVFGLIIHLIVKCVIKLPSSTLEFRRYYSCK